jgi:hypothetical protein
MVDLYSYASNLNASKGFKNLLKEYCANLNPSYLTIKRQGLFVSTVSIQVIGDEGNVKVYAGLPFPRKKASEQSAAGEAFKDRPFHMHTNTSNNGFRSSDTLSSVIEEPTNQKNISKDVPSNPSINDTRIDIDDLTVSSMSHLNLDGNDNDKEDTEACLGNNSLAGTLSSDSTCEGEGICSCCIFEDKGSEYKNKLQEFIELINTDPSFKKLQIEKSLATFIKNKMSSTGAKLLAEEWDVVSLQCQHGRGDLIFRLPFVCHHHAPFGIDLVVEVKKIDPNGTGSNKTHRTARRKHRREVEKQVIKYAEIWCSKSDVGIVVAAIFTEEDGLKCIRWFYKRYTTPS